MMFPPGRAAALERLAAIRPERYARTRNFLAGDVTRLSPYIRHGMLDLAEVRDAVLARGLAQRDIWKFVFELGWRDYWRRAYGVLGDGVWDDVEVSPSGTAEYADVLPGDVTSGTTGLACIDGFTADLLETGYVHNHARMYVASYVVHHRRIRWQAGARWYLGNLLDGDPSSNNLSWQWVAGTFSADPYIFNRENLERYTAGRYCRSCPLASGGCPFDADYATLRARLFEKKPLPVEKKRVELTIGADTALPAGATDDAVVWVHPDGMNDASVAHRAAPNAPVIAAGFDAMHARDGWSAQRRAFVDASLATMRIDALATGSDAEAIVAFAQANGARRVVTMASPDPLLRGIAADIAQRFAVTVLDPPPFVTISRRVNLKRFSHYWKCAEDTAFRSSHHRAKV
jgi:deoxyribodipyrimidine photo-lyase